MNKKQAEEHLLNNARAILKKEPPAPLDAVAAFLAPEAVSIKNLKKALDAGKAPSPWNVRRYDDWTFWLERADFTGCSVSITFDKRQQTRAQVAVFIPLIDMTTDTEITRAELGNFFELLAHFDQVYDATLAAYERRILARRAKKALEMEKERKIDSITLHAVSLWLARIAGELGLPYRIDTIERQQRPSGRWAQVELKDKVVFRLLLENNMKLSVDVPFEGFQRMLPTLAEQLRLYVAAARTGAAQVFITYPLQEPVFAPDSGGCSGWTMPTIDKGEEAEQ
jgi:hypothetical protein